jgi:hypothetical protein
VRRQGDVGVSLGGPGAAGWGPVEAARRREWIGVNPSESK